MMPVPKKALGQHWLTDAAALAAIVDFAGVGADDTVLEIGPGLGALTRVLLARGARVHAVEFDPALAEALPGRAVSDKLSVQCADVREIDLSLMQPGYKVVANVPYYITSAIVRKLLEAANTPVSSTLLVQKEVARRIVAAPGETSLLSVAAQFYARVKLGPEVAADKFTPPPKVDSQVVRLDYRGAAFGDIDTAQFFRVVKAGFAERRKKLRSSLSGGLHLSRTEIDGLLKKAGIAADARAQELALEDWHQLVRLL